MEPVILEGRRVRLEPLEEKHFEALARYLVEEPDTYRFNNEWRPAATSDEGIAVAERFLKKPERWPFAVIADGVVAGSSSVYHLSIEHGRAEIGHTWYSAAHRGTFVNPESKLLLMTHGFETLGLRRMELIVDARNARSRAAVEKLGAKLDGILRNHFVCWDGFVRDTCVYSVIDTEWPQVKEGLLARVS